MDKMKKMARLILVLVMVLAMAVPAMADETVVLPEHTITITNQNSGHTYEAYQIFSGTISADVLVDIQWGSGVKSDGVITALKANETFKNQFTAETYTAAQVAAVVAKMSADDIDKFAEIVGANLTETVAGASTEQSSPYTIKVNGDGYYIVKDKDGSVTGNDAYTKYIIKVVKDVNVAAKADSPSLEKKIVEEVNKTETLVDANTAEVGETVEYKLTSKVPNMDGYNKYFYVIHDTMSKGLTFNPSSVVVKIGDETLDAEKYQVITEDLTDGCTFEIVLKDFIQYKAQAGLTIEITYSALVNEKAVIGEAGNPNSTHLVYSNNPNVDYKGDDRPESGDVTGETPKDTVITYLTGIQLTKVDSTDANKKLTGAKFKIEGYAHNVIFVNNTIFVKNGEYYRLKDGTYTKEASNENTVSKYEDTTTKYNKVESITKETVKVPVEAEGWVNAEGVITFTGLAEGTYTITELIAPAGYNLLLEPITVVISSNAAQITNPDVDTKIQWSAKAGAAEDAAAWTVENGIIKINVQNVPGSKLPETGGMGTTLFYVVGGALVVGAVVVMLLKKRNAA